MMRSATAFLPDSITTFMNFERSTDPNFGSGRISRLGTSRRRGMGFPSSASVGARLLARRPGWPPCRLGPSTYSAERFRSLHRKLARKPVSASSHLGCQQRLLDFRLRALGSGLLRTLRAVLRTRLLAILDALQVEGAADDVVAHTRQILHAAAAHEHDAVLLQVVAFTADVRDDLETVGQAHLGDLAKRGVRLL